MKSCAPAFFSLFLLQLFKVWMRLKWHAHYFLIGLDGLISYRKEQSHADIRFLEGDHTFMNFGLAFQKGHNGFVRIVLQGGNLVNRGIYGFAETGSIFGFNIAPPLKGDLRPVFDSQITHVLSPPDLKRF